VTARIALLRGVNVGGRATVAMPTLRALLDDLGYGGARTLLQSGNVVFSAGGTEDAALERLLAAEIEKRFVVRADVLVRDAPAWRRLVADNPYPHEAERDPSHLLVYALRDAPTRQRVDALRAAIDGPETVETVGKQAYIVYPAGIGRSRLTGALVERKLETRGTGRNWNTVLKILALVDDGC
jgi:uncharacterized protein (DUF1697 family)